MFIDKAKIFIKAGKGGNGAISFHREKYVAAGGPDAVSYTHLDVYKRQEIRHSAVFMLINF